MKIKEEDVMKLKQLDRIEFRQRWDRLIENEFEFPAICISNILFVMGGFTLLVFFGIANLVGLLEQTFILFYASIKLFTVGICVFLFGSLLNIFFYYIIHKKHRQEFLEEYFEFKKEVKKKK